LIVATRQEQILDAAIEVLGTQGSRQLTHRAVDAAAGLPAGSTSNYFRTRDALLEAVTARFAANEQRAWEQIAGSALPLAEALTAFVRHATGPARAQTLARHVLFTEAAVRPELQPALAASAARIRSWGAAWLAQAGSADPGRDCRIILNYLDGLILHQLAFPDPGFDPGPDLNSVIHAFISMA
jgi:DNA-binding transcriptional regulator YbjK